MAKHISAKQLGRFISSHTRAITLVTGGAFMCVWTMVRFFAKSSNFDLVGQQVLAHQWLSGIHGGAMIGPTNYVLKILMLYMPFDMIAGSQRLKLVAMTLLVNIATFVLLVLLLEKLWRLFYAEMSKNLYVMMLWFGLAAGSIFWIQFTNSRNIEVVGGVLLIYLVIRLKTVPTKWQAITLAVVSGLLFFADPLQLYMTAVPVMAYVGMLLLAKHTRQDVVRVGVIAAALGAGLALSKLLLLAVEAIFKTDFLVVANQRTGSLLATMVNSVVPFFKQAARLYVAGFELGRFVEALNLLFVAGIAVLGVWYVWKRYIPRKFALCIATIWVVDALVYIASGQALQQGTSRYLIMTVPFFVMFAAAVIHAKTAYRPFLIFVTAALLSINTIALLSVFALNWNPAFTKDAHSYAVIRYMQTHGYRYGYASMDAALPVTYLTDGAVRLLPVKCEQGATPQPAYLFFDKAYYQHVQRTSNTADVPLILDGTQLANVPNICDKYTMRHRFGVWLREEQLDDGSDVLIYDAQQINQALLR